MKIMHEDGARWGVTKGTMGGGGGGGLWPSVNFG